jgi:hypothetical protein
LGRDLLRPPKSDETKKLKESMLAKEKLTTYFHPIHMLAILDYHYVPGLLRPIFSSSCWIEYHNADDQADDLADDLLVREGLL